MTSSSNGQILYACFQQEIGYDFYVSTNGGVSWGPLPGTSPGLGGRYTGIACDSTGAIIYTPWQGGGFFRSTNSGSTWTDITNSLGNGEAGDNIVGVATDSTGTKLIVCSTNYIYISTDNGATWTSSNNYPGATRFVACSSDFSVRFSTRGGDIYRSTDPANTTWTVIPGNLNRNWLSLTCSADGTKVFATNDQGKVFYFSGGVSTELISSGGSNIASYSNGAGLVSAGGPFNIYAITYTNPPCFKEDSQILCSVDGKEVYRKIQDLRKGDLVKTSKHGYVPIDMIGTTQLHNGGSGEHRLFRCSVAKYPELIEDLIITGYHSILVDTLTEEQRTKTIELMQRIYVTDDKYRLIACIDDRAEPYEGEGVFDIYHIALEHDDYYMNYGIFANGLLVETCSKRYLKELSGMTLL